MGLEGARDRGGPPGREAGAGAATAAATTETPTTRLPYKIVESVSA